jgi:hypothetical protein
MKNKSYNKTFKKTYGGSDYNSGDGMKTSIWGPAMWHFLHTMSFNYPVEPTTLQKHQYMNFVLSLKYVLPCGKCRKNLRNNFKKLPLDLNAMVSRDTFSLYIYKLHEVVNKMLNKKSGLTYEDVRDRYENFRARCSLPLSEMSKYRKTIKKNKKSNSELGCTEPLFGEKSKCVLKIIPENVKCNTLVIDDKCIKKRL